jgi:hypothetical protein
MRVWAVLFVSLALISATETVSAQASARATPAPQDAPVPRPLGPTVARAPQTFQSVTRLFALRGSLLVHDPAARQLWMLDSLLARPRVILDSISGTGRANWYGQSGSTARLRRFRGDSALFSNSRIAVEGVILDAEGRIARVAAMPRIPDVTSATFGCYMLDDVDDTGWITCQSGPTAEVSRGGGWSPSRAARDSVRVAEADTAAIVAISFATWDVDTIGIVSVGPHERITVNQPAGGSSRLGVLYPIVAVDAWTMLRDGTLVIARGADYHLDVVTKRGEVTRGPRAPYAWSRVTEADTRRILDSLARVDSADRVRSDSVQATRPAPLRGREPPRPNPFRAPPSEWPTLWPAFSAQTPLVDESDRIWIRERPAGGGDSVSVYGIFDRRGQFLERVKVPAPETVIGFGPGGLVYLTTTDGGRVTVRAARFR